MSRLEWSESQWTRDICASWRKAGALVLPMVAGMRGVEDGRPDRFLCTRQWQGWLEFKLFGEKLSPPQKAWHKEYYLRCPGGAYVAYVQAEADLLIVEPYTGDIHIAASLRLMPHNAHAFFWQLDKLTHAIRNNLGYSGPRPADKAAGFGGV